MSQSAWQQKQQREQHAKSKSYRELMAFAGILLMLAGGGFFILRPSHNALPQPDAMSGSAFSQLVQQSNANPVPRLLPPTYKTKGTVDDRYTVATDPKTGQKIINDALGGVGTNSTSVDGDRARLADDMLDLEHYAKSNRSRLSADAYNWLRKVARTGMQLAFGTPGLAPDAQPGIKKDILAEFHTISANPAKSFLLNSKYLALEAVFARPEAAYLADGDTNGTNYLSIDPLSPTLTKPLTFAPSLSTTLSTATLEPTMASLTSITSPYVYTSPTLADSTLSPSIISPTLTTTLSTAPTLSTSALTTVSSPTTLSTSTLTTVSPSLITSPTTSTLTSPTSTTLSTHPLTSTVSSTLTSTSPSTTTGPAPTGADYYQQVFSSTAP